MLILCSGITANAQEIVQPPVPPLPLLPPVETIVDEVLSPQSDAMTAGYWIVETQSSPQEFDESVPVFCPSVTRFEHCAGFRQANMQEMTQSLRPGVPVCILSHGSFVSWQDVLTESQETWKWLHHACPDQPIQMIYFSWPSDRPILSPVIQLDVNRLGRRAGRNGFYMASLVQQIPSECPICLIGHSHGTRVIASALHLLGGGSVDGYFLTQGQFPQHRLRAVFAASAMDHKWLNPGQRYGRALCPVECVLNLKNSCDAALLIYPLRHPFSSGALGFTGTTRRDRKQLGPRGQKIQDLDLTDEIGIGHYWPNYFRRPWLARAIRSYLFLGEQAANPQQPQFTYATFENLGKR
ncbi:MAG: hypothetical protein WKF77_01550 [Planctomycetaceae bacterium]